MMRSYNFQFGTLKPTASVLSGSRGTGVNLTWTDPTPIDYNNIATFGNKSNEVGYNVMRASLTNGKIGAFTKVAAVLANNTSYTDTTADPNTAYAYRIDAFNAATQANPTDPQSMYNGGTQSNVLLIQAPAVTIAAPTNLTATLSGTTANLSWTDNATNETGYVVERSTNGGAFTQIASLAAGTTNYADPNLTNGTYTYQVKAVNGAVSSPYSNTATVNVVNSTPTLAAPSSLSARFSGTGVSLNWRDNASGETGFVLERSLNGGAFTVVNGNIAPATGTGSTVRYTDSTVIPGNTYTYRVKAVNGTGSSGYSNTAKVTTPLPTTPAAPTSLKLGTVTAGRTTDSFSISWTNPSGTITGYVVQYATDSGFTQNLATKTISGQSRGTTITGVPKRKTYYVRVQAVNWTISSPWSNVITVTAP
jgi:hypothetical protein